MNAKQRNAMQRNALTIPLHFPPFIPLPPPSNQLSLPRTPRQRPIAPRARMPPRPQQRPGLIHRTTPYRDTQTATPRAPRLARRRSGPVPATASVHALRRTAPSRRIRRRRAATHTRRRGDGHSGRPAAHPPADSPPMQAALLGDAVVVDGEQHLVVPEDGAPARVLQLPVAEVEKLRAHRRIHDEHARRAEEERQRAQDPVFPRGARFGPARVRGEVLPRGGVGEERRGVEEVAEEGGREEGGRQPRGRAAHLVFVELGQARPQVEEGAGPGEEFAEEFLGCWGI